MSLDRPLKFGYGTLVVHGLLAALAPRKAIALATTAWRLGFENVGDLQPREWYVDATRATGVGMLVAGLIGLALVGGADESDGAAGSDGEADPDADTGPDDDADSDTDSDEGDGPIQVDIE